MNVQLTVFLTASLAVHAGLLSWGLQKNPLTLAIGGQAQSLSVTVVKPAKHVTRQQEFAALEEATPTKPVALRETRTGVEATPAKTTAPAPRQVVRASAITTQRPNPTNSSSTLNINERISAALQNQLASRFEYPWLARKRGWQGQVILSLQVDNSGSLSHWQIATTSGYTVLDHSALKAAREIRYLPEAEKLLNGQPLQLLIPVRYQLLDS